MEKVQVVKGATFTGHKDSIYSIENSNDPKELFSAGADGMVVQWNMKNPEIGQLVAKVPNSIYSLFFDSEDNSLLVGQNFEGIHKINVRERKEEKSIKITDSYIFDIKSHGDNLYVACGDGSLIILEKKSFSILDHLKLSTKSIRCIAFHPWNDVYAVGCSDNSIKILSIKKNQVLYDINAHQNSIFTIAFSPDGLFLITGSRDAHLKIWDCENEFSLHRSIVAHMYAINHVSYHATSPYFATASMDKSIKIWDSKEFRLLKVIDRARQAGHGTSVNKLLWKEDDVLISASDDRTISMWNLIFNQ